MHTFICTHFSTNVGLRNMYKWLPKKEETQKKSKKRVQEVRPESPSQDKHIKVGLYLGWHVYFMLTCLMHTKQQAY